MPRQPKRGRVVPHQPSGRLYHAHQFDIDAGNYRAIKKLLGPGYTTDPLEFTRPVSEGFTLDGRPVIGAHNYAWEYGPATPLREGLWRAAQFVHVSATRHRSGH